MKKVLLSLFIILALCSVVYAEQINGEQIKGGVYTKAETNATIEAAIAAIPTPSSNQTVSVQCSEDLAVGDVVSLINSYGTVTAKKNNLAVNTSPNGAESVFNSAPIFYCSAVALDSTRFLVAYLDASADPHAIVGTVSGSSIAWGSATSAFEAVGGGYVTACKIGTDKVLVCYRDSDANKGRMVVLTISTAIITVGTPADYSTESPTYNSVTQLDTDKALVCYRCGISDTNGESKIITISSTTSTPNPASASRGTTFNAATTSYISVSALSPTSVICAYQDGGQSNYGVAQVLSISGTTITPGTEYVYKAATCRDMSVTALSSTKATIVYRNADTDTYGGFIVADMTGAAIAYGSELQYHSGRAIRAASTKIDSSKLLIVFMDANGHGYSNIATVSTNTATFGTENKFNNAPPSGTNYFSCCYLANAKSAIVYSDLDNSSYGTCCINTWATSDYSQIRGIATANITSGNSAPILLSGEATGLSSLVTGSQYWLQSDFTMGTNCVSLPIMKNGSTQTGEVFLGVAKSSTTLWFSTDYK